MWLVLGVLLGVLLAVFPSRLALLRPAHLHMNLLGFMSMMIFGVAIMFLNQMSLRSRKNYTAVTGKSGQTSKINLGRAGKHIIVEKPLEITLRAGVPLRVNLVAGD